MKTLTGSEKQVAWAEKIRAQVLADLAAMPKGAATQAWRDAYVAECERALSLVSQAKTWIDNRFGGFNTRVQAMCRAERISFATPE